MRYLNLHISELNYDKIGSKLDGMLLRIAAKMASDFSLLFKYPAAPASIMEASISASSNIESPMMRIPGSSEQMMRIASIPFILGMLMSIQDDVGPDFAGQLYRLLPV
jgi:hypothetical protein